MKKEQTFKHETIHRNQKLLKTERGDEKRTKTPVDQELRGTFSFVHQATKVVH